MLTLPRALQAQALADLRGIAIRLGVHTKAFRHKEQWIDAIAKFWERAPTRWTTLQYLSPAARMALTRLLQHRQVPARIFLAEFGAVRRARQPKGQEYAPWRQPNTPAEELFYAGLLHAADGLTLAKTGAFTLADDLRPMLQAWLGPNALPAASQTPTPYPWPAHECLLHDVTHLLLFVHTALHQTPPLALHHGRWLPARLLAASNRGLLLPEATPLPRSHKRTSRLRLLWFLATAADLHTHGALTPAGWRWLAATPADRFQLLWQGWRTAAPALCTTFLLPDAGLPPPWPELLWSALARQPQLLTPAALACALLDATPVAPAFWVSHLDSLAVLDTLAAEVLAGPLFEFGLVEVETDAGTPLNSPAYRLTSLATWLLAADATLPALPAPQPTGWTATANEFMVAIDAPALNHSVATVALFAEAVEYERRTTMLWRRYRLTPASVRQAAVAGRPLVDLLAALDQLGAPLTGADRAALTAWYASVAPVTVQTATLLRTPDKATLAQIAQTPTLAPLLAEILAPRVALLAGDATTSTAPLAAQGYHVLGAPAAPAAAQGDANAVLWLAGQLYARLGQQLPLPLPPPYAALAALLAAVPLPQQAALFAALTTLEERLHDLVEGQTFLPPPASTDPMRWRAPLQQAIDDGSAVALLYTGAGRQRPLQWTLHPYWFEERRGVTYLRAECAQTGDVRLFRLDRIQVLQPG